VINYALVNRKVPAIILLLLAFMMIPPHHSETSERENVFWQKSTHPDQNPFHRKEHQGKEKTEGRRHHSKTHETRLQELCVEAISLEADIILIQETKIKEEQEQEILFQQIAKDFHVEMESPNKAT